MRLSAKLHECPHVRGEKHGTILGGRWHIGLLLEHTLVTILRQEYTIEGRLDPQVYYACTAVYLVMCGAPLYVHTRGDQISLALLVV